MDYPDHPDGKTARLSIGFFRWNKMELIILPHTHFLIHSNYSFVLSRAMIDARSIDMAWSAPL